MPDIKIDLPGAPQPVQVIKTDRQMSRVRFSRCGKIIAAAGRDGTIRRWILPPVTEPITGSATTSNAKGKDAAKKPPLPDPTELDRLDEHDGWVTDIVFHPSKNFLYSADSWGAIVCWSGIDSEAKPLWKIATAHAGWLRQLAISPDGKLLASCGVDQLVCIWSSIDGRKLHEFTGHHEDVYAVVFHPDGGSLVSGDLKGNVLLWDLGELKPIRRWSASALYRYDRIQDVGGVRALAFDADGKRLAVAGANPENGGFVQGTPTLVTFNTQEETAGTELRLGTNKDVYIHDLVVHPRGYWLGVTSGQPGEGQFFMLSPGETAPFFTTKHANCHSIDIHPDGKRIAFVSNAGIAGQRPSKAKEGDYEGNWSPINLWQLSGDKT
jgi:hypothetical protein